MAACLGKGFTLIEMSIALVVIGLLVGGILAGQDLMNAAAIRAQISQIEKYQTAVRTFQLKYGYLPGDIPDPQASSFGFMPRGALDGQGDGNGFLASNCANTAGSTSGLQNGCGETAVFWVDLSLAGLIDTTIRGQDVAGNGYHDYGKEAQALPGEPIGKSQASTIASDLAVAHSLRKPLFVGEAGIKSGCDKPGCYTAQGRAKFFNAKINAFFSNEGSGYLIWRYRDKGQKSPDYYGFTPSDPLYEVIRNLSAKYLQ